MDAVQRLLRQAEDPSIILPNLSPAHVVEQHNLAVSSSTPPLPSSSALFPSRAFRLLIIDNFDSFTHNVAAAFHSLTGSPPLVLLNTLPPALLSSLLPHVDAVVISPGPGHPAVAADIGCCSALLPCSASSPPILGVCLGLQLLVTAHGGRVVHSPQPVHGRLSLVYHDSSALFASVSSPFPAVRYNSLTASVASFPASLSVTAVSAEGEVMAARDSSGRMQAVQFHPESVCSSQGATLLRNWLQLVRRDSRWQQQRHDMTGLKIAAQYWSSLPPSEACWFSSAFTPQPVTPLCLSPSLSSLSLLAAAGVQRRYGLLYDSAAIVDAEAMFLRLFAPPPQPDGDDAAGGTSSWWLDSAKLDHRSRFSFMGDGSGPLSSTIAYSLAAHSVRVTAPCSPSSTDSSSHGRTQPHAHQLPPSVSLFSFMQTHLDSHRIAAYSRFNSSSPAASTSASCSPFPFAFECGWVGYVGYEMRHQCQPSQPERETASAAEAGKAEDERGLHGEPEAMFIFADRFLCFDHREDRLWAVCLYDMTGEKEADGSREEEKEQEEAPQQHAARRAGGLADARLWLSAVMQEVESVRVLEAAGAKAELPTADAELDWRWRWDKAEYVELIRRCLREIRDGQSYELCLTNQLYCRQRIDPLLLYRHLRRVNPAPHAAFLSFPAAALADSSSSLSIACSSPERFVSLQSSIAQCRPIKGTAPRCPSDPERDAALRSELRQSVKDFAENLMIVDLILHDLRRVCAPHSVHVPQLMEMESYSTLHTLVTTVQGRTAAASSPLPLLQSIFPPASMTGAPKLRSCQLLQGMEAGRRGVYSGCIGWLSLTQAMDMNVVIRTAVVRGGEDGGLSIGVGGAIVWGSDEEAEHAEIVLKAKALMQAARRAAVNLCTGPHEA